VPTLRQIEASGDLQGLALAYVSAIRLGLYDLLVVDADSVWSRLFSLGRRQPAGAVSLGRATLFVDPSVHGLAL